MNTFAILMLFFTIGAWMFPPKDSPDKKQETQSEEIQKQPQQPIVPTPNYEVKKSTGLGV